MIEDIAWFEEEEIIDLDEFVGSTTCRIVKILKFRINGEWHIVPTINLIKTNPA